MQLKSRIREQYACCMRKERITCLVSFHHSAPSSPKYFIFPSITHSCFLHVLLEAAKQRAFYHSNQSCSWTRPRVVKVKSRVSSFPRTRFNGELSGKATTFQLSYSKAYPMDHPMKYSPGFAYNFKKGVNGL